MTAKQQKRKRRLRSIVKLIFIIILMLYLSVGLIFFAKWLSWYMSDRVTYMGVTAKVLEKEEVTEPIFKWDAEKNRNQINLKNKKYLVTVSYKNVQIQLDDKNLYKHSEEGEDVRLYLETEYKNGKIVKQELVYK